MFEIFNIDVALDVKTIAISLFAGKRFDRDDVLLNYNIPKLSVINTTFSMNKNFKALPVR